MWQGGFLKRTNVPVVLTLSPSCDPVVFVLRHKLVQPREQLCRFQELLQHGLLSRVEERQGGGDAASDSFARGRPLQVEDVPLMAVEGQQQLVKHLSQELK